MVLRLIYLLAGLAIGLFVGSVLAINDLGLAGWAFLGVLVGAGVTVGVEALRAQHVRADQVRNYYIDRLIDVQETLSDAEAASSVIYTRRMDTWNRSSTFPLPELTDPDYQVWTSAQRALRHATRRLANDALMDLCVAFLSTTQEMLSEEHDSATTDDQWFDRVSAALVTRGETRDAFEEAIATELARRLDF